MRSMQEIVDDYVLDESQLGPYVLPDPLISASGRAVKTAFDWSSYRRPEVLRLFMEGEYGYVVPRPEMMWFECLSVVDGALDGLAMRKEIRLHFGMNNGKRHRCDMLLYVPREAPGPVPVFVGLNFMGNHATTEEADVLVTGVRPPFREATPELRGRQLSRWCPSEVVRRGYASATVCYHDLYPDFPGAIGSSVLGLLFEESSWPQVPDRYTPIGAWAWGLSRMLDYLETEPLVDASRAAVHGHSRLGKTSLWAGAIDQRFKLVISNDSGCGGGALHKRKFGENVEALISHSAADWFVTAFHQYSQHEEDMPYDQHELLALMAPRPLAVHTATEDIHADPKGEFLSCVHASPVYRLFGSQGLPVSEMPSADVPVTGDISFLYRTGKHDQTPEDWAHYLDLADRYL